MFRTLAIALALAASTFALPVAAATFLTETAPAADGSISWDFGNTGGIAAGPFTDTFDILFPTGGLGDGSVTATFTSPSTDLTFTAVKFDTFLFTLFDLPGDHGGSLAPTTFGGGHHTLSVAGISPGIAADYSGTISFTPAAVPEPASWALMIAGFGLAGAALRTRRRFALR